MHTEHDVRKCKKNELLTNICHCLSALLWVGPIATTHYIVPIPNNSKFDFKKKEMQLERDTNNQLSLIFTLCFNSIGL